MCSPTRSTSSDRRTDGLTVWWRAIQHYHATSTQPRLSSSSSSSSSSFILFSSSRTIMRQQRRPGSRTRHQARWALTVALAHKIQENMKYKIQNAYIENVPLFCTLARDSVLMMSPAMQSTRLWYAELTSKSDTDFGDHSSYTRLSFVR